MSDLGEHPFQPRLAYWAGHCCPLLWTTVPGFQDWCLSVPPSLRGLSYLQVHPTGAWLVSQCGLSRQSLGLKQKSRREMGTACFLLGLSLV